MDSIDLARTQRRARLGYEWARTRRAILGLAPVLLAVAIAVAVSARPGYAVAFGLTMFALGVFLLWYGRDLKRAVVPGLTAGALALVVTLWANQVGHACMGGACTSVCLPACAAGGVLAGFLVAMIGSRRPHALGFWVAASGVAVLTGAMGASCIGYPGLLGLAAGYIVGVLPAAVRALAARARA